MDIRKALDKNDFNDDDIINYFANAYFKKIEIEGIEIKNDVSESYEDNEIVDNRLKKGIIDEYVVAWKAGRLDGENDNYEPHIIEDKKTGRKCYLNGYGKHIDKELLDEYLKDVKLHWDNNKLEDEKDFAGVYSSIVNSIAIPDNFGSVYIINLIYFLSKGDWPIYDRFAHIALKAIVMEKHPCEIYVSGAPAKIIKYKENEQEKIKANEEVIKMYMEYLWLMDYVFGGHTFDIIGRKKDRALWVYGHATRNYNFEVEK